MDRFCRSCRVPRFHSCCQLVAPLVTRLRRLPAVCSCNVVNSRYGDEGRPRVAFETIRGRRSPRHRRGVHLDGLTQREAKGRESAICVSGKQKRKASEEGISLMTRGERGGGESTCACGCSHLHPCSFTLMCSSACGAGVFPVG